MTWCNIKFSVLGGGDKSRTCRPSVRTCPLDLNQVLGLGVCRKIWTGLTPYCLLNILQQKHLFFADDDTLTCLIFVKQDVLQFRGKKCCHHNMSTSSIICTVLRTQDKSLMNVLLVYFRAFEDEKKAKMGVVECAKHDLVEPFHVLWERDSKSADLVFVSGVLWIPVLFCHRNMAICCANKCYVFKIPLITTVFFIWNFNTGKHLTHK